MRFIFLGVVFLSVCATQAQITLSGTVKDSIGKPLEMANVIALNKQTKKVNSYGFTDAKGRYKLALQKNNTFIIKVSYVGMKTNVFEVITKENNFQKNIILSLDNQLEGIHIVSKMPVTIKGDTIVYNTDSFTSGREKKLEDVLKKLPGMEVNEDGEIKVEGKKVSKVMVDGKDFFDGDTKLATKNIPANAIDKVEVLKNHSEIRQLKSVTDNEDNVVINIKLKEGKKNFWFGEVVAGKGVGIENLYLAHPKLFYYSPKYTINIITDINNVGKIPFTRKDYFKFSGGFRNMMRSSGTSFKAASSDIGFLTLKNNKAKSINSKFSAVNFSYSPKKSWDISGFAIYAKTVTEIGQNSIRSYIKQSETDSNLAIVENTLSHTNQDSNLGLFKLSSSYKPNINHQFDYDIFVKISKQEEKQQLISSIDDGLGNTTVNPIDEIQRQNPFSINQNINYYYTLNDKNIFAFEAQHLWQDEAPFYNAQLTQLSFANLLSLTSPVVGDRYHISQNKRIKTNKLDVKLDYYFVINNKSNLNITLATTLGKQAFNSSIFEFLNGVNTALNTASTQNNVTFSFADLYAGFHYKFISGIFTFNQGFSMHQYSTNNTQLGSVNEQNFTKLLPDASIKINLKKSETLRFNYKMQVSFTDISQVAKGYVFNNYNRLFAGNSNLENTLSHNINLSYFSFNLFNYTNVFAYINYNKRIDAVKEKTTLEGIDQIATSVNSIFPEESLSASGNFGRNFGKIKLSLGGNISFSKSYNLLSTLQDTDNNPATPKDLVTENYLSNANLQSYKTKISSNFREAPNFDIGYNITINNYNQGGLKSKFITHSPFINVDTYFLKGFIFSSKYTYNNYKNGSKIIHNYSFWDADLSYQKEDSKWEYLLEISNILNTKTLQTDTGSTIFYSTSSYVIQPRYVVFSIKYEL